MRILFISTHNFATNPRLLKEIRLALANDHQVSVLCCAFNNWSKANNENIKEQLLPGIDYYEVAGNRHPFLPWLTSSVIFFLSKYFLFFFPDSNFLLSVRSNKRSWLLMNRLKKIRQKTDLVIAHNPGSFFPAMRFAGRKKIFFGIDLEDFHPGETTDERGAFQLTKLLKNILPQAAYLTAASPLIADFSKKISDKIKDRPTVILNLFSASEFIPPCLERPGRLRLVWFSQNISFDRGLEKIIPLIEENVNTELHLYGNCNQAFQKQWLQNRNNIFLHEPLLQENLHKELAHYDIGLAIEPGRDLNNTLAISNKILAYFQSGIFILASDTIGQKNFIENNEGAGILTTLENDDIREKLLSLFTDMENLRAGSVKRYENAKNFCWENESVKLIKIWKEFAE